MEAKPRQNALFSHLLLRPHLDERVAQVRPEQLVLWHVNASDVPGLREELQHQVGSCLALQVADVHGGALVAVGHRRGR